MSHWLQWISDVEFLKHKPWWIHSSQILSSTIDALQRDRSIITVFVFFLCECGLFKFMIASLPYYQTTHFFLFGLHLSCMYFWAHLPCWFAWTRSFFYSLCWNTENVLILQALLNLSRNLDKKPGWAISCSFTSSGQGLLNNGLGYSVKCRIVSCRAVIVASVQCVPRYRGHGSVWVRYSRQKNPKCIRLGFCTIT